MQAIGAVVHSTFLHSTNWTVDARGQEFASLEGIADLLGNVFEPGHNCSCRNEPSCVIPSHHASSHMCSHKATVCCQMWLCKQQYLAFNPCEGAVGYREPHPLMASHPNHNTAEFMHKSNLN